MHATAAYIKLDRPGQQAKDDFGCIMNVKDHNMHYFTYAV